MKDKMGILVLAAGESSRMGTLKQLLTWGDKTLLEHVVDEAFATGLPVLIVLGAYSDTVLDSTRINPEDTTVNRNWRHGMGSSIAHGLKTFQERIPGLEAVLITLADQPLVDTEYLNQFITTYNNEAGGIIASQYDKNIGVPALFPKSFFKELLDLDGAQGAQNLLLSHHETIRKVKARGKTRDIDTRNDYERLKREDG